MTLNQNIPSAPKGEEVKVNILELPTKTSAQVVTIEDVRSVEGQVDSETEAQKLQREVEEIRNRLDVQTKVEAKFCYVSLL